MPQILTQEQRAEQRQQLSAQQVLVAKLTELSVEELRARIETECEENPWLESKEGGDGFDGEDLGYDTNDDVGNSGGEEEEGHSDIEDYMQESDIRQSTSEENDWDGNEFPTAYNDNNKSNHEDSEVMSFHELLMQQIGEYNLNEHQRTLLEYLIGSLDDDGLLRTPLKKIADEMDIYCAITTNEKELEEVLTILQEFEPCGIGARNLCECLLIQVKHYEHLSMRSQLITMLEQYSQEFVQKHWNVIQRKMKLTDADISAMQRSIRHLNPRPGGSIGRSADESAHIIVPDFKVQVDDYGNVQFQLCENGLPQLQLSNDGEEWMDAYADQNDANIRREVMDAIKYKRGMMEKGALFIEALAQRRRSLTSVMKAIIRLQEPFFQEGDETLLRPMRLEDVAQRTGLDISTVSRVCRSKSVSTIYGTYQLKWFFTNSTKKEGEELSVRHILSALKTLVESEDKRNPYSDEYLTTALQKQGYDVARRTVAKYREQLGIPNSRLRR